MNNKQLVIFLLLLLVLHIPSTTFGNSISKNKEVGSESLYNLDTSNIALSWFNTDTRDMGVDIYFVGASSSNEDEMVKSEWGTYDLNSELPLTPITLRFNITGITSWNLGIQKLPGIANDTNLGTDSKTIGNIYVILDNDFEQLTHYALEDWGYTIAVPKGDHTITVFYINYDEKEGIVYASETITVRIRDVGTAINPYNISKIPLNNTVEDLYKKSDFSSEIIYETVFRDARFFIYRINNSKIIPTIDASFTVNNATDNGFSIDELIIFTKDKEDYTFNLNSVVNTTGFTGLQLLGAWDTKPGITFLLDAGGIRNINTVDNINVRNASLNNIAIISFAPYGLWDSAIPCPDDSDCTGQPTGLIDWEININFPPSTGWGDVNIDVDSSFDYVQTIQGFSFNYVEFSEIDKESNKEDSNGISIYIAITALIALPIILKRRRVL